MPASTLSAVPRSIQDISVGGKSPALRAEIVGPPHVTVNKPTSYQITVVNDNDVAADEVVVRMHLPSWVTVVESRASLSSRRLLTSWLASQA